MMIIGCAVSPPIMGFIANHMKKCFLNWNKDTVEDGVIFNHLNELSKGGIDLRSSDIVLSESVSLLKGRKRQGQQHSNKNTNKNRGRNTNRKRY